MSFSQFPSTATAQQAQNTSLATLLHQADAYSRQFNILHSSSLNYVLSLSSSANQLANLQALPDSRNVGGAIGGGMKERGMIKIQEIIEEALGGVRTELGKMEAVVEQLSNLLYRADLFLSTPSTALSNGLNPHQALTHVSSLFSSYQAELIRLRETLADFTCEEIGVSEFVEEWRVMKEVDKGMEDELGELVSVLSRWAGVGGESLDDMFA